nr:hypothetical protein [uncultured Lichenicoccus sp.]
MLGQIITHAAVWHACLAGHRLLDASLDGVVVCCVAWRGHCTLQRDNGNFSILAGCMILASIFFMFDGVLKVMPPSDKATPIQVNSIS